MATPAERTGWTDPYGEPPDIVEIPQVERLGWCRERPGNSRFQDLARAYGGLATEVMRSTKRSMADILAGARKQTGRKYSGAIRKAKELTDRTQTRVRYAREEMPLESLAVLAGAAFLAGITLRIWRSRS